MIPDIQENLQAKCVLLKVHYRLHVILEQHYYRMDYWKLFLVCTKVPELLLSP